MKKMIAATGCFVIFCLIINSVLIPSLPDVSAENASPSAESSYTVESSVSESSAEEIFYMLKEYEGKIAVYISSSDEPAEITDASVSKLPKSDQAALKEGIKVTSEKELNRLIEDFCS